MAEQFDDFLAQALAPPERDPDRAFVARVQAQILLEERLRAERGSALAAVAVQILGVAAVAAGLLWLQRSPDLAAFAGESPAAVLLALLAAFSFLLVLFTSRTAAEQSGGWPNPRLSMT